MGVLRLLDETGLDSLDGNPHALDLTAWKLHADALHVRAEATLRYLDDVCTDTAALLSLTFADNATA